MKADVCGGLRIACVASERDGFVAERRKRRESAENSDEREQAKLGGEKLARICKAGQVADQQATGEIDDQRADRKRRLWQVAVYGSGQRVAAKSANETAQTDQECLQEYCLQFHLGLNPTINMRRFRY